MCLPWRGALPGRTRTARSGRRPAPEPVGGSRPGGGGPPRPPRRPGLDPSRLPAGSALSPSRVGVPPSDDGSRPFAAHRPKCSAAPRPAGPRGHPCCRPGTLRCIAGAGTGDRRWTPAVPRELAPSDPAPIFPRGAPAPRLACRALRGGWQRRVARTAALPPCSLCFYSGCVCGERRASPAGPAAPDARLGAGRSPPAPTGASSR